MQRASDSPKRSQHHPPAGTAQPKVVSLAAARLRRARRRQTRPPLPELDGLDLRGINLERLTPRAREHFWFTVNKHAHHLYATACDISIAETRHPDAPITAAHIQQAEVHRIAGARRSQPPLGWGLALDALMILGAATAGALATKPDVIEGAGILPMAVTLAATVAVFFAREAMLARTCR